MGGGKGKKGGPKAEFGGFEGFQGLRVQGSL